MNAVPVHEIQTFEKPDESQTRQSAMDQGEVLDTHVTIWQDRCMITRANLRILDLLRTLSIMHVLEQARRFQT
jgi:hypothetical protein